MIASHWRYLESLIYLIDPIRFGETTTQSGNDVVSLLWTCLVLREIIHIVLTNDSALN